MYDVKCRIVKRLAGLGPAGDVEAGQELHETMERLATEDIKRRKQADETAAVDAAESSKMLASRRAAGVMLALIAAAYRDALCLLTWPDEQLVNADQAPQVRSIAERFEPVQLAEILHQLSRYERLLWRNVNPRTVWQNVAITCASAAPLRL
jgi:hypothetical protein